MSGVNGKDLDPLPPDLLAILRVERDFPPRSPRDVTRVLDRLRGRIASLGVTSADPALTNAANPPNPTTSAAVTPATEAASATKAAATSGLSSTWIASKLVVTIATFALGAVGGGGAGYVFGVRDAKPLAAANPKAEQLRLATSASANSSKVKAPILGTDPGPVSSVALLPTDTVMPPVVPSLVRSASVEGVGNPGATTQKSIGSDADLLSELALIDMARSAAARGAYAEALDATRRHEKQFPRGQLAEERETIAIQSLVGSGRLHEARTRGARFRLRFPKSMSLSAIAAAVDSNP
ncbi:MAG: hypothetical protein NVS3B20_06700 [Polyangiales bacterium]